MKISATTASDEVDFEISQLKDEDNLWVGRKLGDETNANYITFKKDGAVITNLEVNTSIKTDNGIILERLVELFRKQEDIRQMGFENEEEEEARSELKPYDPQKIKVRPLVMSAFEVNRDIMKGNIDKNPEFQRNFVWDDTRKSRLIESMLLRIPLPAFYFAERKNGKFQVVDGLQRLTVINSFMTNEFKLKNLEYLHDCDGKYYSVDLIKGIKENMALTEGYAGRVEKTQLSINVIESSSPLRVKYDIFYRINTGGRPLNSQEIRNCFASNRIRKLLREMAHSDLFYEATDESISDTRMDGQEISLRFLGFWFYRDSYVGNMNAFLDDCLENIESLSDNELEEAKFTYNRSLELAIHLFGRYAFRKCLPENIGEGKRKQFLNKAMFVVWTNILAKSTTEQIYAKPEGEFALVLANLFEEDDDLYISLSTGTSDKYKIEYVFRKFSSLLDKYLMNDV